MQKNNATQKEDDHDVIYTLRTISQNQLHLIALADQKANILLGIVVFIITVAFLRTTITLDGNDWLVLPVYIFLGFQLLSSILALFVILPSSTMKGKKKALTQESNPLFFGCYTQYTQNEYLTFVDENITSNKQARNALSIDVYQTGKVLQGKYLYLRLAYLAALIGIIFPLGLALFKLQS